MTNIRVRVFPDFITQTTAAVSMASFVRERGIWLALVVVVMAVAEVAQSSISYTFGFGVLREPLGLDLGSFVRLGYYVRWGVMVFLVALWALKRKQLLFRLLVLVNAANTVILLAHTGFLTSELAGLSARTVKELLLDVVLLGISNILIFSVWYWVIDPPGVDHTQGPDEPWAFLFPQRAAEIPNFAGWQPRYIDYLFVAFTTSFAFSPTDTLPLTRTAKMLMLLQAAISVVTLTGIAGSAINILAGGASGR